MALFAKKQPDSFLGIDLSSDAIKLVELKNFQGKPQLVTYGYAHSKSMALKGGLVENVNITTTLLREVIEKANATSNLVISSLPVSKTFTYVLKIQKILKKDLVDANKIKAILSAEAKKILPMPIEQMQFDYTIINPEQYNALKDVDTAQNVKFLITAASNDIVKKYTQIFYQAGLELVSLDISSFALVRSLVGNDKNLIMIVDFGENVTSMSIVLNGIPVFNRSVDIGGAAITKRLVEIMNISVEEAEQYKKDLPILMKQQGLIQMPKPIEQAILPVVSEIKFLIKTYYEQVSSEQQIDRIILTGGSALLSGFDEYVAQSLQIRTYIGDPWARIIYPVELSAILKELGPRFAVANGLAMTKIK